MSEPILKALMQLFAIIAYPTSSAGERRKIVEYFLKRRINQKAVQQYLEIFDYYYSIHHEKLKEKSKRKKRTSSNSVRVLRICTEINEELTQKQKNVVLVRLLEFIKSGGEITQQQLAFLSTVVDVFHIPEEEYSLISSFVLNPFEELPASKQLLIVDNNENGDYQNIRHMNLPNLDGEIRVMELQSAGMYFVRYIGSSELYLNGQLMEQDKVYVLNVGASIRSPKMQPLYYGDIITRYNIERIGTRISFEAREIEYHFGTGEVGLRPLSFNGESGKLIGIMGSSGAGKSTLLNVLNGTNNPTSGQVLINGIDIHQESEKIEGLIGFVSQDDLLIEELTVFQNLYYNAKLCFANYSHEGLVKVVNNALKDLGLDDIRNMTVGSPLNKKISGGQRKRLNIALELIREPAVLFLDEPTSGLSSRDSENILDLMNELTLKGKLVFAVIHQPSSDIFKMFDKLLILDQGGYLIYEGEPIESLIYFKSSIQHANWNESECPVCGNVNPEQIFNIVETKVLDEFGHFTNERKISPEEWKEKFEHSSVRKQQKPPEGNRKLPEIHFKIPGQFKQFAIFSTRDVLSKLSNPQYVFINLFEAPVLAFILSYIVRYYDINSEHGYTLASNSNLPVYIFMAVIVALFIGLSVSAEEIIKDRKILKRESFLNLSWNSYLFSKIGVQFIISAIQAFLFVIVGNSVLEIKGMYLEYWLILFSAWCFSIMLGLVISDSFKTVITIYILIPFLIIPQLILSGVIVKYERLNPDISNPKNIPFYGELFAARWAYEALAVHQFKDNAYEKHFYLLDKVMSKADYKRNYWIPNIQNKISYCRRHLEEEGQTKSVKENLELIRTELSDELKTASARLVDFKRMDELYYNEINMATFNALDDYFELLKKYYNKLYNKANREKDQRIAGLQNGGENKQALLKLKRAHYNEKLADFVKNTEDMHRIIEYDGELVQKINPIFNDPENPVIKAHFYAPRKQLFGVYYPTFWINFMVIWVMSILLYLILYFRLLRKLLTFFEKKRVMSKKPR